MICPLKECKEPVVVSDLKSILPIEAYCKFEQRSLLQAIDFGSDLTWCMTPGCKYAFVKDAGVSKFNCPACSKIYCLSCSAPWHEGQTCDENRINNHHSANDEKFLQFVNKSKFKKCPECNFWVEKSEGCRHMTCRCKYEFCYDCGGKYRGGCKC